MLILLELFYFVCSKAGQVIWHCWAGLLKALINVRSFVSAEDLVPQSAEESTLSSEDKQSTVLTLLVTVPQKEANLPCSLS